MFSHHGVNYAEVDMEEEHKENQDEGYIMSKQAPLEDSRWKTILEEPHQYASDEEDGAEYQEDGIPELLAGIHFVLWWHSGLVTQEIVLWHSPYPLQIIFAPGEGSLYGCACTLWVGKNLDEWRQYEDDCTYTVDDSGPAVLSGSAKGWYKQDNAGNEEKQKSSNVYPVENSCWFCIFLNSFHN